MVTFARIDALLLQLHEQSAWTDWSELEGCGRGKTVENSPGLYRIRLTTSNLQEVVYIGQSGNLRTRMSMLNGIFAAEMPYRSPQVACCPLWAMRHQHQQGDTEEIRFEVSFVPLPDVAKPLRLGLECVALALYRQRHQRSPRANYGRMPDGYKASSFNTVRLVEQGKRFRGGPTTEVNESHLPGVPPVGSLLGNPQALDWCGHRWSSWLSVTDGAPVKQAKGFYRLRMRGQLLYLGHGKVKDRIKPYERMNQVEYSWTPGMWLDHQYLELNDDLIAGCVLATSTVPAWQFEEPPQDSTDEPMRKAS